jgi:hypothetical protein
VFQLSGTSIPRYFHLALTSQPNTLYALRQPGSEERSPYLHEEAATAKRRNLLIFPILLFYYFISVLYISCLFLRRGFSYPRHFQFYLDSQLSKFWVLSKYPHWKLACVQHFLLIDDTLTSRLRSPPGPINFSGDLASLIDIRLYCTYRRIDQPSVSRVFGTVDPGKLRSEGIADSSTSISSSYRSCIGIVSDITNSECERA